MTKNTLIEAVQAHFGDESPAFQTRIDGTIPVGIEMFVSEQQWEHFDKYVTATTEVDSTTGKTRIVLPTDASGTSDFFKPVHIWTDNNAKVDYIDRAEWADRQRLSTPQQEPWAYTQIGPDLFLDRPNDGSTLYMVYTRTHNDLDLPDLPSQYHPAVLMAVIWYLTPGYVMADGQKLPNSDKDVAWANYQDRLSIASSHEHSVKDRVRRFRPDRVAQRRNHYR